MTSTARSAPIASALRSASIAFSGPIETTTTSPSPAASRSAQRLLDRVRVELGERELAAAVEPLRRRIDARPAAASGTAFTQTAIFIAADSS